MSDRAMEPHPNSSEMSGQYTSMKQSAWMGHWMQAKYTRLRDGNLCLQKEDCREFKQHSLSCNEVSEPSGSESFTTVREVADNRSTDVINKIMKKGGAGSKKVPGTQTGQCSEFNAIASGTIKPRFAYVYGRQLQEKEIETTGCRYLPKETTFNLELELRAGDSVEGGCMPTVNRKEEVIPFASSSKEHPTHRSSYHDFNVETMRISSTLDVRDRIHLGPPMYTETTRHFFFTEKTAIGVSDEGRIFRESMLSAKFNRNLGGPLGLSPASGQIQPGLKLHLLDGSTDSEQKDNRGSDEEKQKDEGSRSIRRLDTVAGFTDEISAETRTMEVETSLENNRNYGPAVSTLNKDALGGQITVSSQGKSANIGLPDMNEAALSPDGLANEEEPCTSKTQSLDMECLIYPGGNPSNSNSIPCTIVHPRPELGSRWVKRLKMSGSYTKYAALGTKSSTIQEASSYEKLGKLSSNLLNLRAGLQSSEPTTGSKKTAEAPNSSNGRKASTESSEEDRHSLLSHPWIRRWCHDQTKFPKQQQVPTEPSETPKTSCDHFQKKVFPSIAAMALMGKAMNGFRPCQFTKKGSFIVWNSNNLPHD